MKIDITDLRSGKLSSIPLQYKESLDVTLYHEFGVTSMDEMVVEGTVRADEGSILADVKYSIQLAFQCGRCLKDLKKAINGSLLIDLTNDDLAEDLVIHHQLELRPALEDDLHLNMPMQVLCEDDCKGLCPMCGVDLNIDQCDCNDDKVDPRLESLKNFFN